jgi:hypothetical protein
LTTLLSIYVQIVVFNYVHITANVSIRLQRKLHKTILKVTVVSDPRTRKQTHNKNEYGYNLEIITLKSIRASLSS